MEQITTVPVALAHKQEEENGEQCPYCESEQNIFSEYGMFRIRLAPNGVGQIELGYTTENVVFSYCPMCGKKLKGE